MLSPRGFGGVCALAFASGVSAETIGPWTLDAAPVQASLLAGGGSFWDWLNIVDVPLTVDEAFTGFSIIDDGYGNAEAGTTVEVIFEAGALVNHAGGPDLVFFEGQFTPGTGMYALTVDGFEGVLILGTGGLPFIDSGVDRSYFYGFNHQLSTADVFGAEIDLDFFGVTVGDFVTTLRIEVLTDFRAPLGFGALVIPTPGSLVLLAVGAAFAAVGRRRRGTTSHSVHR